MFKSQITNPKLQTNPKFQLPNVQNKIGFGHWLFGYCLLFGIWLLVIGISSSFAQHEGHQMQGIKENSETRKTVSKKKYQCPMHPQVISDKPGKCPICGMNLSELEEEELSQEEKPQKTSTKENKILYYRNPMDPSIISPTPMKDSMGMDYIPVYERGETGQESIIKIKESQQQLIGVKTEPVLVRPLTQMIRTVAKIAFDPELYKAEQEFIQAYKTNEAIKSSGPLEVNERLGSLVLAAEFKLKLLGLSDEQVAELKTKTESDSGLIISDKAIPYVWAYLTIYEYDLDAIKIGDHVNLRFIAFPGKEFSGKIVAIDSVLDMNTRSVRARVRVDNPEGKIKPNMYGDSFIHVDLGDKLAVPRQAVLDTGLRKIVYLDLGKGEFKAQEIEAGPEAIALVDGKEQRFFSVIKGLKENDSVVTNGNFLIDSQSQLTGGMSALWGAATEIKQEGESEIETQHRH